MARIKPFTDEKLEALGASSSEDQILDGLAHIKKALGEACGAVVLFTVENRVAIATENMDHAKQYFSNTLNIISRQVYYFSQHQKLTDLLTDLCRRKERPEILH